MIGEQAIIHNAGESDTTLRLLHAAVSWRRGEDTSDAFEVVLQRLRRPHLSRALLMCWCISSQGFGVRPAEMGGGLHNEGFRRNPHFRLLSSAGIDRPASGKKPPCKGWISFFPPSDGASGSIFPLLVKLWQPLQRRLPSIHRS